MQTREQVPLRAVVTGAARAVLRAVDAGRREVDVPRWLGGLARAAGALPNSVRGAWLRRVAR